MKELIPLNSENGLNTYSARNLYDYLGLNPTQWSRWYKKNISNNPFAIDGKDYRGFDIMSNGNKTQDFEITIDFAERISMMQKTEKGEEVRVYFQQERDKKKKLEELLLKPQSEEMVLMQAFQILNNKVNEQKEVIAKLTPKADYVDKITSSDSFFTTTQIAAPFGLSAQALNKFLIERGVIRKNSDDEYTLISKYMNKGYEYYQPVKIEVKNITKWRLCWTELGRAFIHNLIDPFKRVQLSA